MAISPDGIIGNAVEAVTSQLAILNNTAGQYRGELSAALAQIAAVQVKDVADLPAFLPPDLPAPEPEMMIPDSGRASFRETAIK